MGLGSIRRRLSLTSFFKHERPTDSVDVLGATRTAVNIGRQAANAASVPGLSVIIDLLDVILEQAENARANKEGLEALCTEIEESVNGITAIAQNVAPKLDGYPVDSSVRMALRDPERAESRALAERISLFQSQLEYVETEAVGLARRTWWQRWISASHDANILAIMKDKIAHAYRKFEFDGSIRMEQLLDTVVNQIIEAETNKVLDKLAPGPNPSFRAAINSGKAQFLPGTRRELFNLLDEWVDDVPGKLQDKHALILEGGAGMGKSTIASELCKRLQGRGRLGASFFFTRGTSDLESATSVIPSMVKQLAEASETFRPTVTELAKRHLKDGGQQQQVSYAFTELFEPLRNIESLEPIYIVIDALDECRQDSQARDLPELCSSLLAFVTESTSFRLFLTTRPIPDNPLREAIQTFKSSAQLYTISLYDPLAKASIDEDIAKLIRLLLNQSPKARQRCAEDDTIVPRLVKRANGLFVYARTAATFLTIESGGSFDEALELLLSSSPDAPRAKLNDLDKLYSTVLTTAFPPEQQLPPKERVRSILAGLIIFPPYVPSSWRQYLSGIPPKQSVSILEKLRPVLTVNDEDIPVERRSFRIMHDTFREFVTSDKSHAGNNFHISIAEAHTVVAIGSMKVLCAAVEPEGEVWAMDGWDGYRLQAASYACNNWEERVSRSRDGGVVSEERDALAKRVGSFLGTESQRDVFVERWRKRYDALRTRFRR